MYYALSTTGGIIVTVPQHNFLWSKTDVEACHVCGYTKKELVDKVQEAGFHINYVSSFVLLLFLSLYISSKSFKNNNSLERQGI